MKNISSFAIFILFVCTFLCINHLDAQHIHAVTIAEFVQQYPQTKWTKCMQNYAFEYPAFPLYQEYSESRFPSKGYHSDMSVIEIPNGVAYNGKGYMNWAFHFFVNDLFIKETQIKNLDPFANNQYIGQPNLENVLKVTGRVAIINHTCTWMYFHWIADVLSQLALLEINNIKYDYLWIPYNARFMQETLNLWGIDRAKIIPLCPGETIMADTIILPTSVSQTNVLGSHANYCPDFLLKYIREKLLNGAKKVGSKKLFSKKVFISRKDATRAVPNEDEIFALFEPFGFERYELTSLSAVEQITLFCNAQTIVAFMGSGSANIIFCHPGTRYIEILQSSIDATFCFISDTFKLQYHCINASTLDDLLYGHPQSVGRKLPLNLIEDYIKTHHLEL